MSNLTTTLDARVPDSSGSEHITAQSDIARDLLWKVHGLDRVCLSCGAPASDECMQQDKKLCNHLKQLHILFNSPVAFLAAAVIFQC